MALATSHASGALIEVGDRPGADMTARLLLALTALYVQRPTHTVEEQQQYVELALRLIDEVGAATRTAVAGILQRHPQAPAEVIERLGGRQSGYDGNPEGEPPCTQDQHSAGNQYFESNPHLADGECASAPAPSDTSAVRQLTPITSEFGEAFFAATPVERRRLPSPIARCGDDLQAAREDSERNYGRLNVAVLQGRIGELTCEFERLIDIPTSLCERILNDPSGEPVVVAAKAAGMPIAMLQRILLLAPAVSHSVQRVYELTELYHRLDRRAARDLLALWRAQAKPNDPIPEAGPNAGAGRRGALRNTSIASLRSRFCALTERVQSQAVNARRDRGSVARRGLRSR